MSEATAGDEAPRPEPQTRDWAVRNPHGIRWQVRFYTSRAAWLRIMAKNRLPGETPNQARRRLLLEGWRVDLATKSLPPT